MRQYSNTYYILYCSKGLKAIPILYIIMSSKEATEQTQLINNEAYTAGEYFYFINRSNTNVNNVRYELSKFIQGKKGVYMRCVSADYHKKTLMITFFMNRYIYM